MPPPAIVLAVIGTVVVLGGRFSKRAVQIGFIILAAEVAFTLHDFLTAYSPH